MLSADRWRRLSLWADRLPLWFQLTLFPVLAPTIMGLAAACMCPRTAGLSVALLAVVYGWALQGGWIDRGFVGRSVGVLYLGFVVPMYAAMLEHVARQVWARWWGDGEAWGG